MQSLYTIRPIPSTIQISTSTTADIQPMNCNVAHINAIRQPATPYYSINQLPKNSSLNLLISTLPHALPLVKTCLNDDKPVTIPYIRCAIY